MTFEEAIEEDIFTPDYTEEMAQDALRTGRIRVYSSYPIAPVSYTHLDVYKRQTVS